MDYRIEIHDTWGRAVAAFDEVPLLEAVRSGPDSADVVRGMLPPGADDLSQAYSVRVWVDGRLFCEAPVTELSPQWSDTRKLILDRYVPFHEVLEIAARTSARAGNTPVSRAYTNKTVSAIVRDVLNRAPGPIHYWVDHTAYPDGAQREWNKFGARRTAGNELEVGGIGAGQWVGADRIDLSGAWAKDGDTLAGVVVDGEAWPDLRMMLIDAEETARNSHAEKRHPEVAFWTDAEYNASGYKRRADAARDFLQGLLDTHGIDYIELNPHRNGQGEFDDRVDAYGRYLGLVYGGGLCYNAALAEQELADVYLYEEGRYLAPEMALKDFFSYRGAHTASVETTGVALSNFDVRGGALELLAALAYAGGGYVFSVDQDLGVRFRQANVVDRVVFHDPRETGVRLGARTGGMANVVYFSGSPFTGNVSKTYSNPASIAEYGVHARGLDYFSISTEADADLLLAGMLEDLAYPEPNGWLLFHRGCADIAVGDLVEVRGDGPNRLARELPGEYGGRFTGRLVARVREVAHRFSGKHVRTVLALGAPLRSVDNPLSFITRSQEAPTSLFELRLDEATVGLDMGFHLD